MPEMQEQFYRHGWRVCRKCRSNFRRGVCLDGRSPEKRSAVVLDGTIPKNETLRLRAPLVTWTAAGPRLGADAVADIVSRRSAIIEATRLMIARPARRATLVASRTAILPAAGLALARRPVFIGNRIAVAVGLHARIGAVRIARSAIVAGSALTLSLPAGACARRTKTARSRATRSAARRATRSTARRATWWSASLVAARRAATGVWLSGQPGRLVDTNLLLWRATV